MATNFSVSDLHIQQHTLNFISDDFLESNIVIAPIMSYNVLYGYNLEKYIVC